MFLIYKEVNKVKASEKLTKFINCETIDTKFFESIGLVAMCLTDSQTGEVVMTAYVDKEKIYALLGKGKTLTIGGRRKIESDQSRYDKFNPIS